MKKPLTIIVVLLAIGAAFYLLNGASLGLPIGGERGTDNGPGGSVENPEIPAETPTTPDTPPGPSASGGCYIGGCSSQVCSDDPGVVTTCEFRPEYACYKTAKCERQVTGQCGWTETATLKQCLANPPSGF